LSFTDYFNSAASKDHEAILLHKPHPRKELLDYQAKQLREKLEQEGLI